MRRDPCNRNARDTDADSSTLIAAAALVALHSGAVGSTAPAASDGPSVSRRSGGGVELHVPQSVRRSLQLRGARLLPNRNPRGRVRLMGHTPAVGEMRYWLGLDTVHGSTYPKLPQPGG